MAHLIKTMRQKVASIPDPKQQMHQSTVARTEDARKSRTRMQRFQKIVGIEGNKKYRETKV